MSIDIADKKEDYAQYLKDAGRSPTSVFHQFRLIYNDGAKDEIYLFFEGGEDSQIYSPIIRNKAPNKGLNSFVCSGKWEVIKTKELIQESFPLNACLFFIDRDYDDFLSTQAEIDEHIYITDFYSIENYLVNKNTLEIILIDLATIKKSSSAYSQFLKDYERGTFDFYKSIKPFIAWILASREDGEKPNLNAINLGKIFDIQDDFCLKKKKDAFVTFKNLCGLSKIKINKKNVKKWYFILSECEEKLWVRGKFDLWYMMETVNNYFHVIKSENPKIKIPICVKQKKYFEVLGGKIRVPDSLNLFLDQKLST